MYYSHKCTYCGKVFYTFNANQETAANTLYNGIKSHLKEYGEDEKEHELDDSVYEDVNQIYSGLDQSNDVPSGGYEL